MKRKYVIGTLILATIIIAGCQTTGQSIAQYTCKDSDGGIVTHLQGHVEGIKGRRGQFMYTDICITDKTLKEWYCQSTSPQFILHKCSTPGQTPDLAKCVEGKCVYKRQ